MARKESLLTMCMGEAGMAIEKEVREFALLILFHSERCHMLIPGLPVLF